MGNVSVVHMLFGKLISTGNPTHFSLMYQMYLNLHERNCVRFPMLMSLPDSMCTNRGIAHYILLQTV